MLVGGCFWLVMRWSGNGAAWRDIHKLALASGPLAIFIIMTPLQEFDISRTDDMTGMTTVGIVMLIILIWLFWKTRQQTEVKENK
jgi:DMSO/TMAO reductase YedYZ heme-binding membrane subunit